jgi:hypothetical protein
MLDVIGAIFGTTYYAVQIGILVGLSTARGAIKLAAFFAALLWLALVVGVVASGALAPGILGPLPPGLLPFTLLLALLFGCWRFMPRFRDALLSIPLPALIALQGGRIGGLFFVLLYYDGRLAAPFAPVAGVGDMIAGALALVLAGMLLLGSPLSRGWLGLWNAFGALDLVVAISLGLLSAAGTPFRVFTEEPGMLAMTALPWIFVPSMLVPIALLVHFVIAVRIRSVPRSSPIMATAS